MHIGFIGLGKMGANMVLRLLAHNHRVTVYNRTAEKMKPLEKRGAIGVTSIPDLVRDIKRPRTIWLMVPWKIVDEMIAQLLPHLSPGDTIIDGGNSPYLESEKRAKLLAKKKINFLDAGVSGGPGGARAGACIMVGGKHDVFKKHERLFRDLSIKDGYLHTGPSGSGHFVKMVHNGIEYGMMQAIAEGFDVLAAQTAYRLDLTDVATLYGKGSVIESRLVDWMRDGFKKYGNDLKIVSGKASATGEGLWTTEAARRLGIPDPVIVASVKARQKTQKKPSFQGKMLMAMRNQFGGHSIE